MIKNIKEFFGTKKDIDLENIGKDSFNMHRYTLGSISSNRTRGIYNLEFEKRCIDPKIVKDKIVFEIKHSFELEYFESSQNEYDKMQKLINNLNFSMDWITIAEFVDDEYIEENYNSKIKNLEVKTIQNDDLAKKQLEYLKKVRNFINAEMKGIATNNHYILVNKDEKDNVIPFFEKFNFKFRLEYKGLADKVLDKYILSEEEYQKILELKEKIEEELSYLDDDFFEEYD